MQIYRMRRMHEDDEEFTVRTIFDDGCNLVDMDDTKEFVYFYTEGKISDATKTSLVNRGIVLYFVEELNFK